ncbi:hypothetical protein [Rhodococcus sp. 14-2470-1a]|uniref:hypothetical protein n=1 Tax=Rhodococcus sp. 14-2470-1a TaxID=2023150 RepID=UPI0015C5D4D1|nr:hypothetical protein [Rhodococcus sp. 14-2470-1a]
MGTLTDASLLGGHLNHYDMSPPNHPEIPDGSTDKGKLLHHMKLLPVVSDVAAVI